MKLKPEEIAAIRKLCPKSSVARDILGEMPRIHPASHYKPDGDRSTDYRERLHSYAAEIRGYLLNMAAEQDELPDEHARLSSEAVGLLIALRDIHRHFPELSNATNVA